MAKSKKQKMSKKPTEVEQEKEKPSVLLADDDSSDEEKEEVSSSPSPIQRDDNNNHDNETIQPQSQSQFQPELAFQSDGRYHNKQRCLILSSRGVTSRFRHFLEDLRTLIPHHKKDSKLDASKSDDGGIGGAVNDIAQIRGCNSVLFLECRKRQDAYLWISRTNNNHQNNAGSGPSAKFLVENIHTMDELRLTGNCMKGSRPVLSFDTSFDQRKELQLLKCLFTDVFGTPRGHPKSKPFVDRVMGFYYADGKIWVRNYQILEEHPSNAKEAHEQQKQHGSQMKTSLVEIGPRFVLNPIRIFRGSFGGQTLYQNAQFVSPNAVRALENQNRGNHYQMRKSAQKKRKMRDEGIVMPEDPLADVFSWRSGNEEVEMDGAYGMHTLTTVSAE